MDLLTHLLAGRLLAVLGPGGGPLAVLATVFAVLPDADTVTWPFPRLRRYVQHRGATHSLAFGAAASLLAAGLFQLAGWASFGLAFLVAFAAFLSHVLLDVLNWGCLLLWPFRHRPVEHTVHAGFAWSAGLSAAGVLLLEVLRGLAPALAAPAAAAMAVLFGAYLAFRLAMRARAARRTPAGHRVVPTGNPFVWRVVGREPSVPLPQAGDESPGAA